MYPRFSETFIVSEILAREAAGDRIEIFSLRPTDDPRFHPELARVQAPVTYIDRPIKTVALWESLRMAEAAGLTAAVGRNFGELAAATADDAVQAINLATALQDRNIRHMHVHFASGATTVARLASFITGIPFSFTAHAVDIFHESVQRRGSAAQARAGPPRRDHQPVQHALPAPPLPGVDVPAPSGAQRPGAGALPVPGAAPARQPPCAIAAVGRLVEKKGFQHLLPAAAELLDQGVKLDLRIAGTGIMAEELEASIDQLRLGEHVRLLGPQTQDQVHELLHSADIFVAPCVVGADGNADGMPTVLLEAMATGVPCVSTSVTGIPEVVRNGSTGVLVRPGNPHALARGIRTLGSPASDRLAVSRNARALIEEDYDVHRQAELLRSLSRSERRVA